MKKLELAGLGIVQDLVGRARSNYMNDRNEQRAEDVQITLEVAFDIIIEMLGKYPQVTLSEHEQEKVWIELTGRTEAQALEGVKRSTAERLRREAGSSSLGNNVT